MLTTTMLVPNHPPTDCIVAKRSKQQSKVPASIFSLHHLQSQTKRSNATTVMLLNFPNAQNNITPWPFLTTYPAVAIRLVTRCADHPVTKLSYLNASSPSYAVDASVFCYPCCAELLSVGSGMLLMLYE